MQAWLDDRAEDTAALLEALVRQPRTRWGGIGRVRAEVELVARADCCPGCGRSSVDVKERLRVRGRDLPLAGRVTYLLWRKRRCRCVGCGRTFTESRPELPARQRRDAPCAMPPAGTLRRSYGRARLLSRR